MKMISARLLNASFSTAMWMYSINVMVSNAYPSPPLESVFLLMVKPMNDTISLAEYREIQAATDERLHQLAAMLSELKTPYDSEGKAAPLG